MNAKQKSIRSVPERHQIKIARQTMKMSDAMARVMGGMDKATARVLLRKLGKNPRRRRRLRLGFPIKTRRVKIGRARVTKRARRNPTGRSEREAWDQVEGYARRITRTARNAGVIQDAHNIMTVAMQMGAQVRRGVHENPSLAVVGALNPRGARPLGFVSGDLKYHRTTGKYPGWYKHHFKTRARLLAMPDGSLRIAG